MTEGEWDRLKEDYVFLIILLYNKLFYYPIPLTLSWYQKKNTDPYSKRYGKIKSIRHFSQNVLWLLQCRIVHNMDDYRSNYISRIC